MIAPLKLRHVTATALPVRKNGAKRRNPGEKL